MNIKLLKKLSEAFCIPSYEEEVAKIIEEELKKKNLKVERDRFGNLLAYKKKVERPRVLAAHMDEIGLMVKYIEKEGFLRFIKIGGIDDRLLLNQFVKVRGKEWIDGVIGNKPVHLLREEERKGVIEYKRMFIDIGAKSREEVEKLGIKVGSPVSFVAEFKVLQNERVVGKALDDRIGCFLLIEIADAIPDDVVLLFTAQEEVSTFGKGAMIASYKLYPSEFIAVDTGIAGDHPEVERREAPLELEKGVGITLVEASGRGNVADKILMNKLIKLAEKNEVKYQLEVLEAGATDAASVYNVRDGIPSIALSIPTRYIHSNVNLLSLKDVEETKKLLLAYLSEEERG